MSILDAAIDRVERHDDGALAVSLRRTDGGGDILVEADDVISATGFVARCSTCRRSASRRSAPARCPS